MNNNFNNFNNMDDIFNQLMGNIGGYSTERRRYSINGREVTPEEFAMYRQTGRLPQTEEVAQTQAKGQIKSDGILAKLGRNLTQDAREGKLDPVIGRNKEIQETSEILARRTKNNPVLVGDAGVGKTAVVEGLAQAIVNGDVPAAIKNKEIISIDISGLEAGTQYRGAFEENVQNLVDEVKKAGNIILFFDEIHQILGAGSTGGDTGSKGLADILKPALSRGELTVIGATTQDEYRNTIHKNAALARRFNEVKVNAPSAEDTYQILKGIKPLYEAHHNIELPDEVLRAAVDYSVQYIPQRSLPDKAIDLIDVTAAHLAAQHPVTDIQTLEAEMAEAKQLALDLFGNKDAIIRLDMSEYSDRTAVSKLIGTTAGYIGYDDNSHTLTERVRRNPYSIVLLDEIEKADPQVITLLLQVLDDGHLTDGQGNQVNFKNTIIIATSNAGFGYGMAEGEENQDIMDRIAPFFRPEFLNRFNAVIEFKHLDKDDLKAIVELLLAQVNNTLAKKGIQLTVTEAAKEFLMEEGYDKAMGARPLRRVIENQIRDKVTDYYLDHVDVKYLEADVVDGSIQIKEQSFA
ncbi:ATP-dependent Clp protease ATP-binding subunit [Streptococcus suis]|nr:ATP-dependent Clp protease ATP-binding subunit [Streptococcus suis]MCK4057763.1 ATP-dependent Clp protease ATP-binding subunit [Streptococcus suis]